MSNLARATPQQWERLNAIGSTYLVNATMRGSIQMYVVDLIDKKTEQPWHSGEGMSASEALENALSTARPGAKPKTDAEVVADAMALASENAKLREMVEALQAQQAATPKRKSQSTETT